MERGNSTSTLGMQDKNACLARKQCNALKKLLDDKKEEGWQRKGLYILQQTPDPSTGQASSCYTT